MLSRYYRDGTSAVYHEWSRVYPLTRAARRDSGSMPRTTRSRQIWLLQSCYLSRSRSDFRIVTVLLLAFLAGLVSDTSFGLLLNLLVLFASVLAGLLVGFGASFSASLRSTVFTSAIVMIVFPSFVVVVRVALPVYACPRAALRVR